MSTPTAAPHRTAPVIHFGRVDTGHYLFEALHYTREGVESLLLRAYAEHVRQMPAGQADADLMREYVDGDEVSWTVLTVGQAARDGEVIVP